MSLAHAAILWALALAAVADDVHAQLADHLHCYKVKDPLRLRAASTWERSARPPDEPSVLAAPPDGDTE